MTAERKWVGAKLCWVKEITIDSNVIIITMYCWVHNINRCDITIYTIIPQEVEGANRAIQEYHFYISLELS